MPPDSGPPSTGALVTLQPIHRRHAAAIQSLAADPEVGGMTGMPQPYPSDGALTFIGLALQARALGTGYHLAIQLRGRCIGACGVKNIDPTERAGEIGYWIGRAFWGRGLATQAVAALTALAREELGLRKVTAWSLEANQRSLRVLEKNGFERVRRELNANRLVHRRPDEYLLFYELTLGEGQARPRP